MIHGQQIGKALIDALGLPKNTKGFTLRVYANEIVTVACEYAPTDPSIVQLLGQFEVVHRGPSPDVGQPVHYDTWLRGRIERARAEYMSRTAQHLPCDWTTEEIARYFGAPIN